LIKGYTVAHFVRRFAAAASTALMSRIASAISCSTELASRRMFGSREATRALSPPNSRFRTPREDSQSQLCVMRCCRPGIGAPAPCMRIDAPALCRLALRPRAGDLARLTRCAGSRRAPESAGRAQHAFHGVAPRPAGLVCVPAPAASARAPLRGGGVPARRGGVRARTGSPVRSCRTCVSSSGDSNINISTLLRGSVDGVAGGESGSAWLDAQDDGVAGGESGSARSLKSARRAMPPCSSQSTLRENTVLWCRRRNFLLCGRAWLAGSGISCSSCGTVWSIPTA